MEPVDVGSLPADEVIEMLFEGGVLHSLLEQHGAACFALAGIPMEGKLLTIVRY